MDGDASGELVVREHGADALERGGSWRYDAMTLKLTMARTSHGLRWIGSKAIYDGQNACYSVPPTENICIICIFKIIF